MGCLIVVVISKDLKRSYKYKGSLINNCAVFNHFTYAQFHIEYAPHFKWDHLSYKR